MKLNKTTKMKLQLNKALSSFEQFLILMEDEKVLKGLSDYKMGEIKKGMKKFDRLLKKRLKKLKEMAKNDCN